MNAPNSSRPGVRRTRLSVRVSLQIESDGRQWQAESLDVSLSGARLRRPEGFDLAVGQPVRVQLPAGSLTLRIESRLARAGEHELALTFHHLGARESDALERFIEREGRLLDGLDG